MFVIDLLIGPYWLYGRKIKGCISTRHPAGRGCRNDVVLTTMRCDDVASTSIQRHHVGMSLLGTHVVKADCISIRCIIHFKEHCLLCRAHVVLRVILWPCSLITYVRYGLCFEEIR